MGFAEAAQRVGLEHGFRVELRATCAGRIECTVVCVGCADSGKTHLTGSRAGHHWLHALDAAGHAAVCAAVEFVSKEAGLRHAAVDECAVQVEACSVGGCFVGVRRRGGNADCVCTVQCVAGVCRVAQAEAERGNPDHHRAIGEAVVAVV